MGSAAAAAAAAAPPAGINPTNQGRTQIKISQNIAAARAQAQFQGTNTLKPEPIAPVIKTAPPPSTHRPPNVQITLTQFVDCICLPTSRSPHLIPAIDNLLVLFDKGISCSEDTKLKSSVGKNNSSGHWWEQLN